jgi:hypothetical protein
MHKRFLSTSMRRRMCLHGAVVVILDHSGLENNSFTRWKRSPGDQQVQATRTCEVRLSRLRTELIEDSINTSDLLAVDPKVFEAALRAAAHNLIKAEPQLTKVRAWIGLFAVVGARF